ncbi:MAG: TIGR00296 family protein [Candidatus Lutacidiplasmatales archaeon]
MASREEGEVAVRLAREAISTAVLSGSRRDAAQPFRDRSLPELFDAPRGVFVTLERASDRRLRGCIGYPLPVYPLRLAVPRVAVAAALDDARFPPVARGELLKLTVEVSLLTLPEPMEAEPRSSLPGQVRVGHDGLIVDGAGMSGLLLPQVAVEQGWDSEEFLGETCLKGGLPRDAWRSPYVRVRRFSSERFRELRPEGEVVAEGLSGAPAMRSG